MDDTPAIVERAVSQPGPIINGKPSTTTLFSPSQLVQSTFLQSMQDGANEAFSESHSGGGVIPRHIQRVPNEEYLLGELGKTPGTFTYIIHENETDVLATATMRPFVLLPFEARPGMTEEQLEEARRSRTFARSEGPPPGMQGWELKMMFVSPRAQRQGLAELLMRMCEIEAIRRMKLQSGLVDIERIHFMLTTIEELNGAFYRKRGYKDDARTFQPVGTLESETGFTILHMSKTISTE